MKTLLKKSLPLLLIVAVLVLSGVQVSCKSSSANMYERKQTNKSRKVKSNIKVKGTNQSNSHTTRSY